MNGRSRGRTLQKYGQAAPACWCGRPVAADYPGATECEEHDEPPTTPRCPLTSIPTRTCAHCRKATP